MATSNRYVAFPKRAMNSGGTETASQSLTVSTAAVSPTGYTGSSAVDNNSVVVFDVQTSNVRVRWDGTSPTSTVGHLLYVGSAYTWDVDQFNAAKFIRDTAATADAVIFSSPFQI
jgi:hypothetical protein